METIYYKNRMVLIGAEGIEIGAEKSRTQKWQPQWWIWSKNYTEIVRFFYSGQFNNEERANVFAGISAMKCIDFNEV